MRGVNGTSRSFSASEKFLINVHPPGRFLVNGSPRRHQDEWVVALFVVGNEPTTSKGFKWEVQPNERASVKAEGPLGIDFRLDDRKKGTKILWNEVYS
jgi:hypothetical protein